MFPIDSTNSHYSLLEKQYIDFLTLEEEKFKKCKKKLKPTAEKHMYSI